MILELIVIFAALVLLAIIMLLKLERGIERGIRKQNNKLLKNLDSDLIKDITDE